MSISLGAVKVRLAENSDAEKLLQVSEGIYRGGDYIPLVLQQWLNDERRHVFLAEYDGEAIGMMVATIAENRASFVSQSLRIHPKYRGKRLSYQIVDAVAVEMCKRFPEVNKNYLICSEGEPAYKIYSNRGCKVLMEKINHVVGNISSINVNQNGSATDPGLVSLNKQDAFEMFKSKSFLELISPQYLVVGENFILYKLPEEAHLLAEEAQLVLVSKNQDGCSISFSYGLLTKGVSSNLMHCFVYTSSEDESRRHISSQLNTALSHQEKVNTVMVCVSQTGGVSSFDEHRVITEELFRLNLSSEESNKVMLIMEEDLSRFQNENCEEKR